MNKKIESIDCYRGFAALTVAFIHFAGPLGFVAPNLSFLAVHFFFTLSGFVIFVNYSNKINNFISLKIFIKKRFLRIYPLHFLLLLVFLVLEIGKFLAFNFTSITPNYIPFTNNNMESFILSIFLLNNLLGNPLSFNAPSWSVAAEFFSYVVFALLSFALKKYYNILSILFIIFYSKYYNDHLYEYWGIFSYLNSLFCFFIGTFFGKLYLDIKNNNIGLNIKIIFIIFIFLNLIYILNNNIICATPYLYGSILFVTAASKRKNIFTYLIFNKFFVFLGKISYSIYMLHALILWVVLNSLRLLFDVKYIDFVYKFSHILSPYILLLFLYVVTIGLSYISYKFIEIKFYKI